MNRRSLAMGAVAFGIVLILLAVLGDTLGIGGQTGFGWKQGLVLAVGLTSTLLGVAVLTGVVKPRGARDEGEAGAPPGPGRPPPPPA